MSVVVQRYTSIQSSPHPHKPVKLEGMQCINLPWQPRKLQCDETIQLNSQLLEHIADTSREQESEVHSLIIYNRSSD